VAEVFFRPLHRFACFDERSEVHDGLRPNFGKSPVERRPIANIALDQLRTGWQRGAMPVRKIVIHHRLGTASQQPPDPNTSDVTCPTSHQDAFRHDLASLSRLFSVAKMRTRTDRPIVICSDLVRFSRGSGACSWQSKFEGSWFTKEKGKRARSSRLPRFPSRGISG